VVPVFVRFGDNKKRERIGAERGGAEQRGEDRRGAEWREEDRSREGTRGEERRIVERERRGEERSRHERRGEEQKEQSGVESRTGPVWSGVWSSPSGLVQSGSPPWSGHHYLANTALKHRCSPCFVGRNTTPCWLVHFCVCVLVTIKKGTRTSFCLCFVSNNNPICYVLQYLLIKYFRTILT
jgi:hypothetical protein